MVRFLHTADWQLGMTRHYLSSEAEGRFRQARIDVVARMAELTEEHDCDFALVAGDVFETNQVDRATVARTIDALQRFPVPVLLLPGNHDPLDAGSVFTSSVFAERCPDHVRVLDGSEPVVVADGVEVVGAPWTSKDPLQDLAGAALAQLDPATDRVRVLAAHGAVDSLAPHAEDPALIRLHEVEAALDDDRAHFVALGDHHSAAEVGSSGRVWYAGTPEPTDYREQRPGQALVVDVDAAHCDVTPVAVGEWRFVALERHVDGEADIAALSAELDALPGKACTVVKIALTGTVTLNEAERLDEVLADAESRLAALERPARHQDVCVRPADDDFSDIPLTGYAAATRDRLQQLADAGGEEGDAAVDALALLLRLSSGVGTGAGTGGSR